MSNRNWLKKVISDSWHTKLIPATKQQITELERNEEFLYGITGKIKRISYPRLDNFQQFDKSKWAKREYYVLFPGVSSSLRQWPVESFAELADRIYYNTGLNGILDGVLKEKSLSDSIQSLSKAPLEWAGTDLKELTVLLKFAKFVVSVETSACLLYTSPSPRD